MSSISTIHAPVQLKSTASPVRKWLHENPAAYKVAIFAAGVFGLKLVIDGLNYLSITLVSLGAVIAAGAYLAAKAMLLIAPPTHNPQIKAFQPGECRGVSLSYEGNLPILKIPGEVSDYDAGYARGFLMAPQIRDMLDQNDFAFHTCLRLPKESPALVEAIKAKVPAAYLKELEGLAAGYNAKRDEWRFFKGEELTLEKLIYLHLLPEFSHLDFKQAEHTEMGCTVVIDGDSETGPRVVRTVDWIPMDAYGKYSFVEMRDRNGIKTVGHNFPMYVGAITAMNQHGFGAAINVTRGTTDFPEGMPSIFYVRHLIENCHSVVGENSAQSFWEKESPIGPFNLTVFDPTSAASVHFFQNQDRSHHVRWYDSDHELVTLNFRYSERGEANPTPTNSRERKAEIAGRYQTWRGSEVYDMLDSALLLKSLLLGSEVNNIRTVSAAYLDPKERTFEISFDNGYAGDRPLMKVPAEEWFG